MAECTDHNLSSNRLPTGADDPCNSSGEGYFWTGAYWLYDPTLAGADTAANGDCARLFVRTGDTCNVAEWLELSLQSLIVDLNAPTAADCCPSGSLWSRPDSLSGLGYDEIYISIADLSTDPPTCGWCRICSCDDIQSLNQQVNTASVLVNVGLGALPAVFTEYGVRTTLDVSNPSTCAQMSIYRTMSSSFVNIVNQCGVAPALFEARIEWSTDGGGTWNTTEIAQVTSQPGEFTSLPLSGLDASFVQAVGATSLLTVRAMFRNPDGNFCGQFTTGDKVITVEGVNFT